jgi:hypothetical protein
MLVKTKSSCSGSGIPPAIRPRSRERHDRVFVTAALDRLYSTRNGIRRKLGVVRCRSHAARGRVELLDSEFFAVIREGREPNASVEQVLPCYRVLSDLERRLDAG